LIDIEITYVIRGNFPCAYWGNIAFEIATIMQERGLNVDKLVLLDSHPPKAYKEEILDTSSILESFPFVLNSFLKIVIKPEIKIRSISEYYETLKHENSILNEISFEQFNLLYNIWKNNHLCLRGYEHVLKYKGQVFLLEAQEMESDEILKKMRINYISKREWEYYVNGKLEIISIPGNHYTILSKPNSLDVCKHIEAILQ
jgi:thioesterase domain-containing protein